MSRIRSLLLRLGYAYDRVASRDEILNAIRRLKPRDTGYDLIRIGGNADGGYLKPDDLEGVIGCFSPGVSTTADFECMLAERYGIKSYLADYSVEGPPLEHRSFDFEKKYLGTVNDDVYMRLEDWVASKVGAAHKGI